MIRFVSELLWANGFVGRGNNLPGIGKYLEGGKFIDTVQLIGLKGRHIWRCGKEGAGLRKDQKVHWSDLEYGTNKLWVKAQGKKDTFSSPLQGEGDSNVLIIRCMDWLWFGFGGISFTDFKRTAKMFPYWHSDRSPRELPIPLRSRSSLRTTTHPRAVAITVAKNA